LIKGNVVDTDKAIDGLLTFCVNPIAELLSDEINRKLYKKKAYLSRTYLKIDTTRIRNVNIKDVAGSLDILLRIGSYSIDDCLKILGMEPLETEWSKSRWMTKNYEKIGNSGEEVK
jgi:HK97 family phage portal protein